MPTESNKIDPRVKRTRELIMNAFITVVTKKGFESITVKDITSEATINRATFYAHFTDKYALLDTIISERYVDILQHNLKSYTKLSDDMFASLVESICEYFDVAKNTCKRGFESILPLMGKEIVFQLTKIIYVCLSKDIPDNSEEKELAKLTATMVSNSIYSAVYQWEETSRPVSQELLIDSVLIFVSSGINLDTNPF